MQVNFTTMFGIVLASDMKNLVLGGPDQATKYRGKGYQSGESKYVFCKRPFNLLRRQHEQL